jgi:hypothetical protein
MRPRYINSFSFCLYIHKNSLIVLAPYSSEYKVLNLREDLREVLNDAECYNLYYSTPLSNEIHIVLVTHCMLGTLVLDHLDVCQEVFGKSSSIASFRH